MAGKRINKTAPLTAAEKQKRHREKKAAEKNQSEIDQLSKMREVFISDIEKLSLDEFREVIKKVYGRNNPGLMTLEEMSKAFGISLYELKKLRDQGVIEPEPENALSGIDPGIIAFTGLTVDEFLCLCKFLDKPMTTNELSKAANIPMHKLERLKKIGLINAA